MNRLLPSTLALVGLSSPAWGLMHVPEFPEYVRSYASATCTPTSTFGASAVGDLDGNLDPDVVYALGDDVLIHMNVAVDPSWFLLGRAGHDVTIVPRAGGPDQLVVAAPDGVAVQDLTFDSLGHLQSSSETLFAGDFAHARALAQGQLDGQDGLDLAVLCGTDRRDLRALVDTPGAPCGFAAGTWSAQTPLAAWDLRVIAPPAPADPYVATVGAAGIVAFGLDGSTAFTHAFSAARGVLERLPDAAGDKLVWIRPFRSGEDLLLQVTPSALSNPTVVGGAPVVGVAVGDIDGDGDADLALGNDDPSVVHIYPYDGVSGTFSTLTIRNIASGFSASSGSSAEPAVGDFDGDGRGDVALGDGAHDALVLCQHSVLAEYGPFQPRALYLDFTIAENAKIHFKDANGPYWLPEVTHLRARAFKLIPVAPGDWSSFSTSFLSEEDWNADVSEFAYVEYGESFSNDFAMLVELRFVALENGHGSATVQKWPPVFLAFVADWNVPAELALEAYFGSTLDGDYTGSGDVVSGGGGPPPPGSGPGSGGG